MASAASAAPTYVAEYELNSSGCFVLLVDSRLSPLPPLLGEQVDREVECCNDILREHPAPCGNHVLAGATAVLIALLVASFVLFGKAIGMVVLILAALVFRIARICFNVPAEIAAFTLVSERLEQRNAEVLAPLGHHLRLFHTLEKGKGDFVGTTTVFLGLAAGPQAQTETRIVRQWCCSSNIIVISLSRSQPIPFATAVLYAVSIVGPPPNATANAVAAARASPVEFANPLVNAASGSAKLFDEEQGPSTSS